jgi:hypothetical protein
MICWNIRLNVLVLASPSTRGTSYLPTVVHSSVKSTPPPVNRVAYFQHDRLLLHLPNMSDKGSLL